MQRHLAEVEEQRAADFLGELPVHLQKTFNETASADGIIGGGQRSETITPVAPHTTQTAGIKPLKQRDLFILTERIGKTELES